MMPEELPPTWQPRADLLELEACGFFVLFWTRFRAFLRLRRLFW
jgi:hypothetical protein